MQEILTVKNNINTIAAKKSDCSGCRACFNICPVNAVTMKEDEEGFFYPAADNALCTNCSLCRKVCPALNKSEVYKDNTGDPDCYAAIGNDELRAVSSSGGAFSVIANEIFEMGGVVCGAAFVGQRVQHIIIEKASDLHKLRGSKYLQSDTNTVFSQIKKLLQTGKTVLFSGTPCQVAGLNLFLGKKYDRLYTVDLLCHGVPPQRVFDKYLEETIKEGEFLHTSFRDKTAGWNVYTTTTTTTAAQYRSDFSSSTYLQAFIKNMCLRPSCGACKYTSTQREADITIGDFWAIERYKPELNDHKGTSVILFNSRKGKDFYKKIKGDFAIQEKVPIEYAKYYNITLYTPLEQHPKRHMFFRMLNEGRSLKEITDYCNCKKYDVAILNFWNIRNMGGAIQAWALQHVIQFLGYSNALINYCPPPTRTDFYGSFVERFAKKNLIYTEIADSFPALNNCNEYFDTFVLGSDCIWGNWWTEEMSREISLFYYGSFISSNKKIISYAPSFGNNSFCRSETMTGLIKYYLDKMDHISVRENSGVNILKDTFGIDAVQVLDPTLLLNSNEYDELIKNSDFHEKGYIFNYSIGIRDDDTAYQEIMHKTAGHDVITMDQTEVDRINVEDWLYLIKNAGLLITNSYHACCFAIKFNVPFYIFSPFGLDTARFDSLLGMLNLQNRLLRSKDDVCNIIDLYAPIAWDKVNSIIQQKKIYSLNWLKNALDSTKNISDINPADDIIKFLYAKVRVLEYKNQLQANTGSSVVRDTMDIVFYRHNILKYFKYRIFKNFVSGRIKERYKRKQKLFHEKILNAKKLTGK